MPMELPSHWSVLIDIIVRDMCSWISQEEYEERSRTKSKFHLSRFEMKLLVIAGFVLCLSSQRTLMTP